MERLFLHRPKLFVLKGIYDRLKAHTGTADGLLLPGVSIVRGGQRPDALEFPFVAVTLGAATPVSVKPIQTDWDLPIRLTAQVLAVDPEEGYDQVIELAALAMHAAVTNPDTLEIDTSFPNKPEHIKAYILRLGPDEPAGFRDTDTGLLQARSSVVTRVVSTF